MAETALLRIPKPVLILTLLLCCMGALAQQSLVNISIVASPLSDALIVFARQTQLSVIVSQQSVDDLHAPTVIGNMTARQALDKLLAGTGLKYQYTNKSTVVISVDTEVAVEHVKSVKDKQSELATNIIAPIDNITVTALRHRAYLQKTPAAVTVIDQQTLQYDAIKTLDEVSGRVPGLTVSSFSLGQPTIHIRGIGSNDDGAAMDQSVVVFIDDVYMGRITGINLNMLDLAQVEVLRGPQGALYGKNVIGGAIKLMSQKPTPNPQLATQLSIGNYNQHKIKITANGPIKEGLLGRFVVEDVRRDGWQNNIILGGEKQHNDNKWGLRAQLVHNTDSDIEFHWSIDLSQDNLNSSGRIPVGGITPITVLDNNGNPIPVPGAPAGQFLTRVPEDIFRQLGGDPLNATNGDQGYTDRNIAGISQRMTYQHNDINITSITAVRDTQFDWLEDSVGLPTSLTNQRVSLLDNESHQQFSQELRGYNEASSGFSYLFGLYFLYEHTLRKESFLFSNDVVAISDQDNHSRSYAVFGQLNYELSRDFTASLGGRYTQDIKMLQQSGVRGDAPSIIFEDFTTNSRASWRDFSPQLLLSYDAGQDFLLYASITKGVKSGGFQGTPGTREQAQQEVSPEVAWDYELGVKSQWWDNRLRFNAASFFIDYRDLQVVQFRTIDNFGSFLTSNAASASVRGVEVELDSQLTESVSVAGSYAFLRAIYDKFDDALGRNFAGNQLRQAPKHSVNLAVQYQRPTALGKLRVRADYRYQSESFREPDNVSTRLPSFRLFDGNITLTDNARRWEMGLWVKNLLDERYISHLYVFGGNDYGLYGLPRTYGMTMSWNFL